MPLDGSEGQIGAGAGGASPAERVLHITKLSLGFRPRKRPARRFLTAPPRPIFLARRPPPLPTPTRSMADTTLMDKLVSLCKRRGFVFQSSEIYGGLGSVWDYGPLGVELKKNVKDRWWHAMVHARDDIEGLDAAILMHPRVWEASRPRRRLHRSAGRLPQLQEPLSRRRPAHQGHARHSRTRSVPSCGMQGHAHRAAAVQPDVQDVHGAGRGAGASVVYLRPETAQGIYVNFLNVQQSYAAAGSVRHRPDRQGVPQRDHARATSSSAPASSSRWRCSSS